HSLRVAPRVGIAWVPFASTGTVVRAGFGLFFDRVPLSVYAFPHYPRQVVSYFDENGLIDGPFFYLNALGQVNTRAPFVFHRVGAGSSPPQTAAGSSMVEPAFTRVLHLRVGSLRSISDGLVTMLPQPPDPETSIGAYELSGMGSSRYRQLEVTAR